ncbi:MAG: YdcF family protein [Candidatus Contendobacter sp.]|nr:YdcF family protein [Candidatus Contendobacter sp.]
MKPTATHSRRFARQLGMGLEGLAMLALSNLALLATGGLSGLWLFGQVWRVARTAPTTDDANGWIVVLGVRLQQDRIRPDYALRLQRAAGLYRANPDRRILLVGGHTGGSLSEAAHGRQFLIKTGLPTADLFTEDHSLHTLDNLRHARQLRAEVRERPFTLVTNRYHLARSIAMAQGLGLQSNPCAAEDRLPLNLPTVSRLLQEAYYLHWYHVGRLWSHWTGNRHNLARIS